VFGRKPFGRIKNATETTFHLSQLQVTIHFCLLLCYDDRMKLDVTCMRYLTKDDFRVLTAVEMGMKNHELVPVSLITSIAQLRHGGSYRILSNLLRHKLVAHALQEYDGYRLSYLGYDILALHALQSRGVVTSVGRQVGVGKESDIFEAMDASGNEIIIKVHRLGRTSFRAVRKTRDYMKNKSKASWLYMSRIAAVKEFAFMKALYAHDFPVPIPIDQNRHVVVMSRVDGFPMAQIKSGKLAGAEIIFKTCMEVLKRLAEHGLIHCDFNEFNLMVNDLGEVTLIDFPQMVSTSHYNAAELLERDINCLIKFFAMKMKYVPSDDAIFTLEDLLESSTNAVRIDEEIKASGFDEDGDIMNGADLLDFDLGLNPLQTGEGEIDEFDGDDIEDETHDVVDEEIGENEPAIESQPVQESNEEELQPTANDNSDEEESEHEEGADETRGATLDDNVREKRVADAYAKMRR
jgi:RIO kinase 2